MRGAPQSGFASAMVRTRSASSAPTRGLPTRPRRDFQVQKARKLCRCQRITVCGFTTWSTSLHRVHHCESHIQKARSSSPNFDRFDRRRSRASCCRSARFSSVRSVRVLSAARRAPNRASTRDIALPGSHDGRPSSSRDRVLARDKSESSSRAMRSNCLANADEFVEATEQVNDRQAHAEKARYLAHAEQRTRRPG